MISQYLPHQERVVAERDELYVKIDKLVHFLDSLDSPDATIKIDIDEQMRLVSQLRFMMGYIDILDWRIAKFGEQNEL